MNTKEYDSEVDRLFVNHNKAWRRHHKVAYWLLVVTMWLTGITFFVFIAAVVSGNIKVLP